MMHAAVSVHRMDHMQMDHKSLSWGLKRLSRKASWMIERLQGSENHGREETGCSCVLLAGRINALCTWRWCHLNKEHILVTILYLFKKLKHCDFPFQCAIKTLHRVHRLHDVNVQVCLHALGAESQSQRMRA
jgi:hypothetical protein